MLSNGNRMGVLSLLVPSTAAYAQTPDISTLSDDVITRSERLRITGTGFGSSQGAGEVLIGEQSAIISRWSNTAVVAYIPETTDVGSMPVQVISNSGGESDVHFVEVTLRQADGRVAWSFEADGTNLYWRPAIAPDGTIYLHGDEGKVYALTPDGGL